MEEPTALLKSMDDAAIDLLNRARAENSVPPDGEGRHAPSIAESVKVFEAVGKYLEWRARSGPAPPPPAKEPSRFEQLRDQFNGSDEAPHRGGRGSRKGAGRRSTADTDA